MLIFKTVVLAFTLIMIAVAGIAVRLWLKKNSRINVKSCCNSNKHNSSCGCG